MGNDPTDTPFLKGVFNKLLRRKIAVPDRAPMTPLAVLEELHAGKHRDYCLYLRPPASRSWGEEPLSRETLSDDIENLLVRAFAPLEILPLEELSVRKTDGLPDEAFLTLADYARVLFLIPANDARFIDRLRLLKESGALNRAIFLMPEQGTLGETDWPATWAAIRESCKPTGIELSPYTAGGWLFRLASDGKACTFRTIANPNSEKIAKALEGICGEME